MAVSTGTATIPSNTATQIVAAANANANTSSRPQGITVTLKNTGSWDCYIAGTNAVGASDFILSAAATLTFTIGLADAIWGKAVQNTATIRYLVTG